MFTPTRIVTEELLDEHDAPGPDMERSLRDLRRINRYLGGVTIYRRLLRRAGLREGDTVLDIGTGTSDLLDALPGKVRRIGLDFNVRHLAYRTTPDRFPMARVAGDAFRLPFADASVDFVTSAHFFHHFTEEENVGILTEASRVARKGVVINDTRRHYIPLLMVRLLSVLRLVGRITRFDAPASVLRGYTVEEARAVAARLPAREAKVVRAFPFRFGILLWK
jgi:ubiquinone/menaquinone biosynthesis C-methylase UbiE